MATNDNKGKLIIKRGVMKKLIFLLITFFVLVSCSNKAVEEKTMLIGMANPWTDCGTNFNQAAEIAGFTFPLKVYPFCQQISLHNRAILNLQYWTLFCLL